MDLQKTTSRTVIDWFYYLLITKYYRCAVCIIHIAILKRNWKKWKKHISVVWPKPIIDGMAKYEIWKMVIHSIIHSSNANEIIGIRFTACRLPGILFYCIAFFFSFLVAGLFTCLESISRFCIELIFKSVYDISLQKRKARWSRRRKRRKGKGRWERHKMHFIIRLSPIGRGEATQCRLI